MWERAHNLTLKVYEITKSYPKEEMFGLTGQIRRSAASIPTNIAEGCGRESLAETIQFLNISTGSLCEVEYQLLLSYDLHYIDEKVYLELSKEVSEIRMMIYSFIQKIRADAR